MPCVVVAKLQADTLVRVCLNAWAYALHPSRARAAEAELDDPVQRDWRSVLYDAVTGPQLQAIVAFGGMAQAALRQWSTRPAVPLRAVPRPSSRDAKRLLESWRATVADLREVVTPDPDGDNTAANYGSRFTEADYAPVPRDDLPFGAPAFLGDDAWVRAKPGGAQNSVERPSPDDGHTLIWHAPGG